VKTIPFIGIALGLTAAGMIANAAYSQPPLHPDPTTKIFVDDSKYQLRPFGTLDDLKRTYARAGMPKANISCLSKACKHIAIVFAGPKNAIDTLVVEPFNISGVSGWAITEERGDTGKIKGNELMVYLASIQALGNAH
jgi:hypothetical protein